MAVTYIEVEPEILNKDAQEIAEKTKTAQAVLLGLVEEMEELNAMWSGRANEAFKLQFRSDVELVQQVLERINKLSECMSYASGEYKKCEFEVKTLVESIKI